MAVFKNYYQVLGVETFADAETVKAAFRKLARRFHPDLNAGNRQAEEKFKEINEAYEILGNPDKRAMHDATLKAMGARGGAKAASSSPTPQDKSGKKPETGKTEKPPADKPDKKSQERKPKDDRKASKPDSTANPINDLFETFLKRGFSESGARPDGDGEGIFRGQRNRSSDQEKPQRGEDVVVQTAITPAEAMEGVIKTVNVQHNEACKRCSGTGKVNGTSCTACHGEKIQSRTRKIDVRIPAGVKNGSRVRVAKEGGRGRGGAENGDLFLQLEISYDPSLRIEGLDVYGEIALSVTEAVLGGEVDVPTLHGPVKMTIPAGTQPGKVFRLKDRGVQNDLSRGDHFVTVTISIPENLSAREKELYQELSRLRPNKTD